MDRNLGEAESLLFRTCQLAREGRERFGSRSCICTVCYPTYMLGHGRRRRRQASQLPSLSDRGRTLEGLVAQRQAPQERVQVRASRRRQSPERGGAPANGKTSNTIVTQTQEWCLLGACWGHPRGTAHALGQACSVCTQPSWLALRSR